MSDVAIAVGAAMGLVGAALFAAVGARTLRRAKGERTALRAFAVFWLGAAGYVGADSAWAALHVLGADALPLAVLALQAKLASVCASFAGLVVYLARVYRGDTRWRAPVAFSYLALFLALEAYYLYRIPVADRATFAAMAIDYARAAPKPVWDALLVLLFVPPIVATVAYATLARHASDGATRTRIRWTTASLLLFFAPDLVAWLAGSWPAWPLVERALALASGLGVIVATRPVAGTTGAKRVADSALAMRMAELI